MAAAARPSGTPAVVGASSPSLALPAAALPPLPVANNVGAAPLPGPRGLPAGAPALPPRRVSAGAGGAAPPPPSPPDSDEDSSSSSDSDVGGDAAPAGAPGRTTLVCVALVNAFPPTTNERVEKDRWRKVRLFVSAMLAEPAFNVFAGCNVVGVKELAIKIMGGEQSAQWMGLLDWIQPVVFVWEFLLLVRRAMDQSLDLSRAVGELLLFSVDTVAEAVSKWEATAGEDAKKFRDCWTDATPDKYQEWLREQGVPPPQTDLSVGDESFDRVVVQADEERTGQVWPGRAALRACMEDKTSERDRKKAAIKRSNKKDKKKKPKPSWEKDDCRHYYPPDVLRAPGVMTYMCACGYIMGFEMLREIESPAHVVASLAQRFKTFPKVIYFDTACQAQRNALRRVPWLLHEAVTAWFIDRFHRCNHKCSPTFDADQYPEMTRGHDTSGAERQHSIKKKSKNSLFYMSQTRFIVRSRYIAAHNNVRVSQRRDAALRAGCRPRVGVKKQPKEIQHYPVETYFHKVMVSHCEVPGCTCRELLPVGPAPGLMQKV